MNEEITTEQELQQVNEEQISSPEKQSDSPEKKKKERSEKSAKRLVFMWGMLAGAAVTLLVSVAAIVIRDIRTISKYMSKGQTVEEEESDSNGSIVTQKTTIKMAYIEKLIKDNYYKDIDRATLEDGVYRGMLDSLDDPYSVYYNREELEEVREQGEGIYYGIGAYIALDPKTELAIISGVMSGTPAEESGLETDDIIFKVDGVETTGMSTSEVVALIKGPEHTKVVITVVREGESDFLDIEVERRKIESPTVNYEMKEDNIGYIQITEFDDVTTDQFTEAMAVLKGQGMKGLVIDLRSNGGGNLSTCVDIASQLLPEGIIVYTEDKFGKREEFFSDGKREFDKPLVVLVNGYSASASEILTGAIKDYGIGKIMGTTTYGKGIVQSIMPLSDGSAVKMTISRYFTPKGKNIHGVGIDPDIEVEYDSDAYKKDKTDNQLNAAMDEIRKELKQ